MWRDWKEAFKNKKFALHFFLSLIGLITFVVTVPIFFSTILLPKHGVVLNDFVLNFFKPRDWSTEIFIALYLSTILAVIFNIKKPKTILLGLQVYVIVNFSRMISLYLFTLEAPEGIIPLSDPFLNDFVYGQSVYVKDLFFSGHVSSLFLLFLIEQRQLLKWVQLLSTVLVSVLLAWQRVHYTIDMVAAIIITWMVFRFFTGFNTNLTD